jgi:hypothetical protein
MKNNQTFIIALFAARWADGFSPGAGSVTAAATRTETFKVWGSVICAGHVSKRPSLKQELRKRPGKAKTQNLTVDI